MTLQEEIEIRRKRFIDVSAELVEAEASAIKAEGETVKKYGTFHRIRCRYSNDRI